MEFIDSIEFILLIIYSIIILAIGWIIKSRNQIKNSEYKYFVSGLFFKLIGATSFCLIYLYYYKGGDTINYFFGAKALANLLLEDFDKGYHILFNTNSPNNDYGSFNNNTGYPAYYMWKDANTFSVSRFSSIFVLLGAKSFFVTSLFTACLSYVGIWKIFQLYNNLYPNNQRAFAYLILFIPSLVFWGSGIMKDSFVLGATCWITYNFYQIFIARKRFFWNILFLIMNLYIIINTKAYVVISLMPGMLLWVNSAYLQNVKNLSKIFVLPVLIVILGFGGYYALSNLSQLMGVYGDVDTAIQQAQIIQEDLLREEQYGRNNYNIGVIDGTVGGMITMAPIAIFTAIYRPLFWEAGSPVMLISIIENTLLLLFTFYILFRTNPFKIFRIVLKEPILLYAIVFSLLFSFGVGIAGTNFGALVRYKIPLVPFFFPMLYMIFKTSRIKKNKFIQS